MLSRSIIWSDFRIPAGITTLAIILLLAGSAGAVPVEEWSRTFGDKGGGSAYSVAQTKDGGYVFAGGICSNGDGQCNEWIVKTDAKGNEQWSKTFGKGSASFVRQTSDGGYILLGRIFPLSLHNQYAQLIKTDTEGNEQWNRTFSAGDGISSVQQTLDGGYILVGAMGKGIAWFIIKVDANGNEQWNKTFWGGALKGISSVQQTSDGGYILSGNIITTDFPEIITPTDAWLIKVDADGNEQWNRTFGGTGNDRALFVQQALDGSYIISGVTSSYGAGYEDVQLKYSKYLFNWEEIPGNDSIRLIEFLKQKFDIEWVKAAKIEKIDDGRAIKVSTEKNYILLKLSDEKINVKLDDEKTDVSPIEVETDDGRAILVAKIENGNLSIYDVKVFSHAGGYSVVWLIKTDAKGNELWNRTFSEGSISFVQQTSDKGYIFAGYTESSGANSDAWLIEIDTEGNELWNKTFGGTKGEIVNSVQQTREGGYILAGTTQSYGEGRSNAWLIKVGEATEATKAPPAKSIDVLLNNSGAAPVEKWNRTFGGRDEDRALSIQHTSDGGYILAGSTCLYGAEQCDAWIINTDANGNEKWNRTFNGAKYAQQTLDGGFIFATGEWLTKTDADGNKQWNKTLKGTKHVRQTSDGGYVLVGTLEFPRLDVLIKIDAKGNEQWNKTIKGGINSLQQTTDGSYILAGIKSVSDGPPLAFWFARTDASGNEQWNRTFGGKADWANAVQQTLDGGYIVAGRMYTPWGDRALLIKTDANGNEQWSQELRGKGSAEAYYVQQTSDEGYILAGVTELYGPGGGAGSADMLIIKTDANGNEQWSSIFRGKGSDYAYSVQQTKDGGYIIAGTTNSYGAGGNDAWLIKISVEPEAKAQTTSPTEILTVAPTQTPTVTITEIQTVRPTEKIAGFEIILAITALLVVHLFRRNRSR